MRTIDALCLGIVQGLTEFLPVSSTAHLYLTQALLGIPNDALTLSFDVVLHLGTLAALLLVTWRQLAGISSELLLWIAGRPPRDPVSRGLLLPVAVGTVPGALAGVFLLKRFEGLRTIGLIGLSMLAACVFFLLAEWHAEKRSRGDRGRSAIGIADGWWVGIAQAAAGLLAGLSRSGLTISAGRARGLAREEAARFSFLLAVPIILGAGAKSVLDLRREQGRSISAAALAVGFLSAAVVGYVAARFLLRFLRTHDLRPFAVYLGFLGLTLLVVSWTRGAPLITGRAREIRSPGLTTAPPQTVTRGLPTGSSGVSRRLGGVRP